MKNNSGKQISCKRFEGTVTIITGGGSGIGFSTAQAILKEGGKVLIADIKEKPSNLYENLEANEANLTFAKGDMSDEQFCKDIVDETAAKFGRVDHLLNNAFSFIAKGINAESEDWKKSWEAGPLAFARMIQNVTPYMKKNGGGSIVNVSSISGWIAQKDRWTYNTSKGAVNQLTKCTALDLAKFNIRINSISPGWIWSQQVLSAADANGGKAKWDPIWGKYHMLGRCGKVEECAEVILFLLGPQSSFITGSDIPVDGGYRSMGPEGIGEMGLVVGAA